MSKPKICRHEKRWCECNPEDDFRCVHGWCQECGRISPKGKPSPELTKQWYKQYLDDLR